jgi:hypothetical protein
VWLRHRRRFGGVLGSYGGEDSPDDISRGLFAGEVGNHSLMHNDHTPYYVRVGDSWTKIDYAKRPREWMVPLKRGRETDLIEIPASWYLDDLPPMMFIKKSPKRHRAQWLIHNLFMRRSSRTENISSVVAATAEPGVAPMPPILPVKRDWRAAVLEAAGAGP